ncbi:hypothetical protein LMG7974_01603 [Campylobacter majalis]|uniref:Uncharacterized protein n=1 Tax=Campylobacter majalis TaxID=2790656 RepID=A0ABM8Q967_9BACT|nr:hypothetical protein [Campylobacter majalis]CAD7289526.1 hypothetical protein LMG7974_01603 [Campylobacter majalis]
MEKNTNKIEELNDKLANLVLMLQRQNRDLLEDTNLNAMHIKQLRERFEKAYNGLNGEIRKTNENCDEFSQGLEVKFNENGNNNYSNFIKELIKNDFTAIQNNIIEELRRELGSGNAVKTSPKSSNLTSNIALILSIVSFIFLMILNFKFNLFLQILG